MISYVESVVALLLPWVAQIAICPTKTHDNMSMWVPKIFNVSFSLFMALKSRNLHECIFVHVCVHVSEHCMTE